MVKAPDRTVEINKDGTDIMFWDRHAKTGTMRTYIIPKDKITSIQFSKTTVRKRFKKTETEMITIVTRLRFEPFIIYATEEPKYYDEYKEQIKAFAKKNMLTCREAL